MLTNIYQNEHAPCRGCEREIKSIGCHGKCAEYISYKERMENAREERHHKKEISEYLFYQSVKRQKGKRR